MKEDIKKHNEHVLRTCEQEQARFASRERQVRSNQRMRAAMIIIVVAVILIIAWVIAGIMRETSMFIVAGVASGVALLSLIQLIPFRLGYTRVKQGYVVTSCFQLLRRCNYIPDTHKGKPVIGIAAGVFKDKKKMYYISLPASLTHLGKECFMNCRDLRGVTFRGKSELQYLEEKTFCNCINLYAFCSGGEVIRIGESAFENCRSLRCAYFGENVEKMGRNAFASCGNLSLVSASSKVTELLKSTFNGCRSLVSMPLPSALERIEDYCFGYCAAMEAADIPEKVAYIGKGAYTDCRSLKEVTIRSKPEFIGNNAFRNCDKAVITFTAVKKQDKNWNGQWADKRCEVKYSK